MRELEDCSFKDVLGLLGSSSQKAKGETTAAAWPWCEDSRSEAVTYTATEVNHETKCWIVKRWKDANYDEAEIWGAESEQQAIEMAVKRGSWA